jgi:hypothetical protein
MVRVLSMIWLLAFIGCFQITGKQEPLKFRRQINRGSLLRIDGCYYATDSMSGNTHIFVFYQNGVVEDVGAIEDEEFQHIMENGILQNDHERMAVIPWAWGLYRITPDSIKIEKWYPSGADYVSQVSHGIITNDTTFTIFPPKTGENDFIIDGVFHFLQLKAKPDSTNNFIPLK